jgi:peptide/nickel transport system ATP-binding protein
MIILENLRVSFADTQVIRGVSLRVERGESYGLVGESGSGKSTILRAITGLAPISGGRIVLEDDALDPGRRRSRDFLRRVQMVFQDPYGSLHPRHTVDRVLREALIIQKLAEPDRRIDQALDDVGLGRRFRYRYPHQLSGGQRQRVAIARALITEPEILLLDEPTSALDVSVQAEVLNLLDDLRQARQLTFILVSHNLPVITHMCDRIGVLHQGQLVEELSADSLDRRIAKSDYTQALLKASEGYVRSTDAPHRILPELQAPAQASASLDDRESEVQESLIRALEFGRSLR